MKTDLFLDHEVGSFQDLNLIFFQIMKSDLQLNTFTRTLAKSV